MTATIADQIIAILRDAGVEHIYGLVGDSLNPIADAIRRDGSIRWIHVHNEEAAAFAACADAQLTGKLAVCAGSCGPGNTHLIQGLFDAHRTGAAVLALASDIPSKQVDTRILSRDTPRKALRRVQRLCGRAQPSQPNASTAPHGYSTCTGMRGSRHLDLPRRYCRS